MHERGNGVELGERSEVLTQYASQGVKSEGGVAAVCGALTRIKAEAERLEVMDKAAGVLAELLYSDQLLSQIKEYRTIMLHVSEKMLLLCLLVMRCLVYLLSLSWTTARHRRLC